MSRLFVVVGAGAKFDAADSWSTLQFRPPLVKNLFDSGHDKVLAHFPLAQSAAPEIRDVLREGLNGQAVSLEHYLRTVYRDSEDPYDRRRFYSIALYLQDLLWKASNQSLHFDNTDRLVASLLRSFEHVCFITLNYDTILDQALSKLDQLTSLSDYIDHDRWSLIKLHGSVDWGYPPTDSANVDNPPPDLSNRLSKRIVLANRGRWQSSSPDTPPRFAQFDQVNDTKLFPALTVPVGEDDEIVCPQEHQNFLDEQLLNEEELDLLILGYSAYDQTVIQQIGKSEKWIRSLMVVNADEPTAWAVIERLRQLLPQSMNGTDVQVTDEPFGVWCQRSLQNYASSLRDRYDA